MVKLIPRDPIFDLNTLTGKGGNEPIFPFTEKNILYFGYARTALYEGLKILKINGGENILLPNYICNVVLSPMHFLNIKVKFYDIRRDLTPDWDSVNKQIDPDTKALLLVNYFGFPNDYATARSICDKSHLYLIEDNAHGFLSRNRERFLGDYGDISIFSFRKTLAIPNGAALIINNQNLAVGAITGKDFFRKQERPLRFIAKSFLRLLKYRYGIAFGNSKRKERISMSKNDYDEEFNLKEYFIAMSSLSSFVLKRINFNSLTEERRRIFGDWSSLFSGTTRFKARPVFPILKEGVVPFCFPALAESRKEFIHEMRKHNIECFNWPYLPRDAHEEYFSKRIVCLPVSPDFSLRSLF